MQNDNSVTSFLLSFCSGLSNRNFNSGQRQQVERDFHLLTISFWWERRHTTLLSVEDMEVTSQGDTKTA